MEIIVCRKAASVAEKGAELVEAMLRHKPNAVFGFATGATPLAMYRRLVERHRTGAISFLKSSSFNLDEYLGMDPGDPNSYRSYMDREFFQHVDMPRDHTHLPSCDPGENPGQVGPRYEAMIRAAGGIDLQILGIGHNGHIGFNEPSSSLVSRTRVKTLTPRTLEDNSRLFAEGDVQPSLAITMGIATIMDARRILLLATGELEDTAPGVPAPLDAPRPSDGPHLWYALQWFGFAIISLGGAALYVRTRRRSDSPGLEGGGS